MLYTHVHSSTNQKKLTVGNKKFRTSSTKVHTKTESNDHRSAPVTPSLTENLKNVDNKHLSNKVKAGLISTANVQ